MVEDRTPGCTNPVTRKTDKGVSPKDKSHAILELTKGMRKANHGFNIREERDRILSGKPFSPPWGPFTDWYDGQDVREFV
jgi:hypothetical protein